MRNRIPDSWPGLVAIAILVAGTAIVHARPATTETGGYLGGEFLWSVERDPDLAVTPDGARANAASVDAALIAIGPEEFEQRYLITIVASFASTAEATAAARQVDVPAETLVLQQGPLLIVTPLAYEPDGPPDRRVAELAALGGSVLVEGDRYGEGTIVVDMACDAGSAEGAAAIATEFGDFGAQLYYTYPRPPWIGPPLTADEALARATYRRWVTAVTDAMTGNPILEEFGRRYLDAGSAAEREALTDELAERMREHGDELLGSDVHPGVAAVLAAPPREADPDASAAWGLELGRFLGPLPRADPDAPPTWFEQRSSGGVGSVQAVGTEVRVGWLTFHRFALGFTQLLAHLEERGCADVRVRLTDFDEVRGD